MIDGNEKRNRLLAFELQNSHVCEKRSSNKNKNAKCVECGVLFLSLRLQFPWKYLQRVISFTYARTTVYLHTHQRYSHRF